MKRKGTWAFAWITVFVNLTDEAIDTKLCFSVKSGIHWKEWMQDPWGGEANAQPHAWLRVV